MAGTIEEALARVQAIAANTQCIQKHHKSTLVYISELIFTYLFGIVFISFLISWLTAPACITYLLSVGIILIPPDLGLGEIKKNSKN